MTDITKYFSLEEANRTLPYIKKILMDIINTGKQIRLYIAEPTNDPQSNDHINSLKNRIINFMKELDEIGCYYKDWNFTIGLVDFPSIINGKKVMLCWRSDEEKIKYYHEIETGYAGRKLITEELLFSDFNNTNYKF